jgi:hypothetical protein
MTGRIVTAFSLIVLVLGLAACGGDNGSTAATETTTTFDTTPRSHDHRDAGGDDARVYSSITAPVARGAKDGGRRQGGVRRNDV